jgi:hypothetical protein
MSVITSSKNVTTKRNPNWWDEFKATKTKEYDGVRESDDFRHEENLLRKGIPGLHPNFTAECSDLIARSIEQVAAGKAVEDLDRATKTNIGPAIERKFLERFGLPQLEATEKIDTRIAGVLIDIKTTIRNNWMIHTSCIGKWCLLFTEDCTNMTFSIGFAFITPDMLTKPNGDDKSQIAMDKKHLITWVIEDEPLVVLESDVVKEVTALRYEIVSLRKLIEGLVASS